MRRLWTLTPRAALLIGALLSIKAVFEVGCLYTARVAGSEAIHVNEELTTLIPGTAAGVASDGRVGRETGSIDKAAGRFRLTNRR